MSVINTNMSALIGQKNLDSSQNSLQTSMERLSSGLRINSAKDDAAGQAIANRMSAQITGLAQAQRNSNDGISLAQTAEGSLGQVTDNLQRVRELTVQAQNGTNSAEDLQSIQDEIGQRLGEIDRISEETNFNGVNVLAQDGELKIQVGANDGETISVDLKQINSETLNLDNFDVTNESMVSGNLDTANSIDAAGTGTVDADVADIATVGDISDGTTDITPDDTNVFELADGSGYAIQAGSGDYYEITTNDVSSSALSHGGTALDEADVDVASGPVSSMQVTADIDPTGTAGDDVGSVTQVLDADGNETGEWVTQNSDGTYSRVNIDVTTGDGDTTTGDTVNVDPLTSIDDALGQVDSLRSELGAVQNRFESAVTNLGTNETNLTAARSRIEDADYATEVSEMTRAQILQQAGTSVLAQANQVPQTALSLLG